MTAKFIEIPSPSPMGRLSNNDILFGKLIPAIDRLRIVSASEFEDIVFEWAHGYLKKQEKYIDVKLMAGAGDKGRDIVGVIDTLGNWENYQCKHYDSSLTPSGIAVEIGKIVYFTFNGDYRVPKQFYFVSPKGVGTKLNDYLSTPDEFKKFIIENWSKYCESEITKTSKIRLQGNLKKYIDKFDFSIFKSYNQLDLIEQHAQTIYHAARFGGGLKGKPKSPVLPNDVQKTELKYVAQLCKVYSERKKESVNTAKDLSKYPEELKHFNRQRLYFYHAECLSQFSRDQIAEHCDSFEELKDETFEGIIDVHDSEHLDGMDKLTKVLIHSTTLSIESNPLKNVMKINDKKGICHHLANDERIVWV